jgi:tetratricopeptide (TPR) repeat protein
MSSDRHQQVRHVVLTLLAITAGCASGGGVWREVTTPHFVVRTDHDSKTARQIAEGLEADRDLLVSGVWPKTDIPEWSRSEVYVLSDRPEFEAYFGANYSSCSLGNSPPQYFLKGSPGDWEYRRDFRMTTVSTLRFHVAMRIATLVYPEAPNWFDEGIATFLETAHPSEDGRSVVMGSVNVSALGFYRDYRLITVERLLGWGREQLSSADSKGLEGLSWLFVHWLINTHSEPFARYRAELSRGADPKIAFAQAFPGFDARATDEELNRYSKHGDYSEIVMPLLHSPSPTTERPLDAADVHVVRARLINAGHSMQPEQATDVAIAAQVRAEIEQALAVDPTNVDALWLADWTAPAERLSRARRSTEVHPRDPRAWELTGDLLRQSKASPREQEAAYRQAVALAPHNPETLSNLAWALMNDDRAAEALPLAVRAMRAAPQRWYLVDTYAAAMSRTGHCSGAISAGQHAVQLASAGSERADAESRLAGYQAVCAAPAGGTRGGKTAAHPVTHR